MARKNQIQQQQEGVKKPENREIELSQDRPVFVPVTDIYENEEAIMVVSDMPGVDEKKIDITLEDDVLTITGHQCLCEPEGHELLHRGYEPGIFRRSFTLLAAINREKILAKIANGVLKVTLPKAEEAKPRKIKVVTE